MKTIKLRARAKINLSININGVFEDGYHDVEMVMQSIDLSDYILIRRKSSGYKLTISNSNLISDKRNIIYKTWQYMKEKYKIEEGIEVFLEKNIPIAAGMAGGSADSAAMFVGINKLFDLGLDEKELIEDSKALGSDIAFCISGGTALAYGKGADIQKLKALNEDINILVCKPNQSASTRKIYSKFDRMFLDEKNKISLSDNRLMNYIPNNKRLIESINNGNCVYDIAEAMGNVLEPVTRTLCSDIDIIKKIMDDSGSIKSMMSGSGPTVFGFFSDNKALKKCSKILRNEYINTYVTRPSSKGVEICVFN